MDNLELNLNELESAVGGSGGSKKRLTPTGNFDVYQIRKGDTLGKIARKYNTTAEYLKSINPTIRNINDITADYWIFVPAQCGIL